MKETIQVYLMQVGQWCKKNKLFAAIVCVQMLVVLYFVAALFAPKTVIDLPMTYFAPAWESSAVSIDEEAIVIENSAKDTGIMIVTSSPLALGYGAYTVRVAYESNYDVQTAEKNIDDYAVALYLQSTDNATQASENELILLLRDAATSLEGRIWTSRADTTDCLMLYYSGIGQTTITSVQIEEQIVWRFVVLLMVVLGCLLVDFCWCLFFARVGMGDAKAIEKANVPCALCGIALLATMPSFGDFIYRGHDLPFHMVRIASVAAELANGQFPVRMMTEMLNGYGYANSLFYCDIFLYLPAVLYNCMISWQTTYLIYLLLVNFATVGIAYYCFKKLSGERLIALTGAMIYILASYRLTNIYTRGAVGEYTAMVFFPLVVLGVWNIYKAQKPRCRDWLPLALGMAGIIQSHVLSVAMAVVFLVLICLALYKQTFTRARIQSFGCAALLCAGLTAWFWVPFIDSYLRTDLNATASIMAEIQDDGLSLMQLFSFSGYLSSGGDQTLSMPLGIGWGLLIGLGIALYYVSQRDVLPLKHERTYQASCLALVLSIVSLCLTLSVFPWTAIAYEIHPTLANLVNTIQFPWRYLSIASICLATLSVFALVLLKVYHQRYYMVAIAMMLGLTLATMGLFYAEFVEITDTEERYTLELIDTQIIVFGEYLLEGSVVDNTLPTVLSTSDAVIVENYEKVEGVAYLAVSNTSDAAQTVLLPIFNYPNYQAKDAATGAGFAISNGENNRIQLTVDAGYSGTILVAYVSPWYWHVAELITLASWLYIAWFWYQSRKGSAKMLQVQPKQEEVEASV